MLHVGNIYIPTFTISLCLSNVGKYIIPWSIWEWVGGKNHQLDEFIPDFLGCHDGAFNPEESYRHSLWPRGTRCSGPSLGRQVKPLMRKQDLFFGPQKVVFWFSKGSGTPAISRKSRLGEILFHLASILLYPGGVSMVIIPSLKLTAKKAPDHRWLEDDRFVLGWPIFRGELLVSGSDIFNYM